MAQTLKSVVVKRFRKITASRYQNLIGKTGINDLASFHVVNVSVENQRLSLVFLFKPG
jgi:hypothetical protein